MSPQTFIFIGRSGCGKGTQAKLLNEYIKQQDAGNRDIYYVETGAQFRDFIKKKKFTNKRSQEIYARDDRQPDFLAIWMWSHNLVENLTGKEHLVLDGTPRSLPEATVLDNALAFYARKANIIHLDVSREWSQEKLLARGRSDDATLAKINKRLDWFDKDVAQAIDYFQNNPAHNYIHVNGEQGIDAVHAEIVSKLKIF